MPRPNASRLRDPGSGFWHEAALVQCPRCKSAARSSETGIACAACGFSKRSGEPLGGNRRTLLVHAAWNPRCLTCGAAMPRVARRDGLRSLRAVPLRCQNCGAVRRYPVYPVIGGAAQETDPASGLPYFLQIRVRDQVLWASNLAHLQFLEDYIGAHLRERHLGPRQMTTAARLPPWIKAAGNRAELLRALADLRAMARTAGFS